MAVVGPTMAVVVVLVVLVEVAVALVGMSVEGPVVLEMTPVRFPLLCLVALKCRMPHGGRFHRMSVSHRCRL